MIEQAIYEHLLEQEDLFPFLSEYADKPAIFNQEAPADVDELWDDRPQYGRIVFSVELQGDPERITGGILAVDFMCLKDFQAPEEVEPVLRSLIDGYFFSNGTFTVAAQWRNSSYFEQPTDRVTGCTMTFDLLGFPVLSTTNPDVIARVNDWTNAFFEGVHVINFEPLPSTAWKPSEGESAVYWRLVSDAPAGWIPDTFSTIWRTATIKCHVFSENFDTAASLSRDIALRLHAVKRLIKSGESQIMVNRRNTADIGANPLRTGQVTVEATYGVIVHSETELKLSHINIE